MIKNLPAELNLNTSKIQIVLISIVGFISFVFLYLNTFTWMFERFTEPESYYSHGFLVPFISAYLMLTKRQRMRSHPVEYSYMGLAVLAAAFLIHFVSVLTHIFFISGFSILALIFGTCLFLFGPKFVKTVSPAIIYLIFMLPLPLLVIQSISLPLKSFVTTMSVSFTNLLGIQAVKTGFLINLPDGILVIGNPCSGLRSIFSFLALGAVFVITSQFSTLKKATFLLLCVPIALLSNITRVVFLVVTGNMIGTSYVLEGSFYHDFSGYAVFLLGLIMMALVWRAFK